MEKKVFLGTLVLLTSLRIAVAGGVEEPCCDWAESADWPLEASPQCPAALHGANGTYCCGPCYASHPCPFEEVWLGQDECPNEEQLLVTSGSDHGFWSPGMALIFPAVFLIIFFCSWLWLKDNPRASPARSGSVVGGSSSSSFVQSQLRARLPPRYGSFPSTAGPKFAMTTLGPQDLPSLSQDTQESQDLPSLSRDTRVRFYQPDEEEVTFSPEVLPASGGVPEAASGGVPEAAPVGLKADPE